MSKRQVLLGYVIVLALALAVPAFGASGVAGIKTLARKALTAATGAQNTANNAQQAAGNAQDAAKTAQNIAGTAVNKANAAEAAANAAQGTANAAQSTAGAAQNAANAAQGTANTANKAVGDVATGLTTKFGAVEKTEPAASVAKGNNIKEAIVSCPANTEVVSGGYHFTSGTAEVHMDEPTPNNGWRVQAQSGGDPFDFVVSAICLKR